MIELQNEKERKQYIKKHIAQVWKRWFGEDLAHFVDEEIGGGILNYVYRVASDGKVVYLKQALENVKHEGKIGKDLASIPKERLQYEEKYIETIRPLLPREIELPEILLYDAENNILALSDVKRNGILLEKSMLNGNFNKNTAYLLGKFLGIQNKKTIGKNIVIRGSEENDIENWHLFLNMRTRGILQRGEFSDSVKEEVERMYQMAKDKYTYKVVMNTDCCPKNVFERKDGIGLVDFEQATGAGDPAYDLGFLIGHYLIMSVIRKDKMFDAINAIRKIMDGYNEEMNLLKDNNHDERLIKYAGMIILYRISSSSPAPYIDRSNTKLISKMKEIAFELITKSFAKFDDALNYMLQCS